MGSFMIRYEDLYWLRIIRQLERDRSIIIAEHFLNSKQIESSRQLICSSDEGMKAKFGIVRWREIRIHFLRSIYNLANKVAVENASLVVSTSFDHYIMQP